MTKYVLKTNNDLQFDFLQGDTIGIVDGDYDGWHGSHVVNIKVENLKLSIPFWIDIDSTPYLIYDIIKIEKANK